MPPGVLDQSVDVFIEVLADPGADPPPGFTAFGTLFVDFTLEPNPSPLEAPGAAITLPTELPLAAGTPLSLFEYDPLSQLFVDTGVVGTVDVGGQTATFDGVLSFSVFVGLRSDLADADGDGVLDDSDICAGTVIPEAVPTRPKGLGFYRWALVDGDGSFDTRTPSSSGPSLGFTIEDTAGCSCEQIIGTLGLGTSHRRLGCSTVAMIVWVVLVNL